MPSLENITVDPQERPFERRVEGILAECFRNADPNSHLALPDYVEGHSDLEQFSSAVDAAKLDPEGMPALPKPLVVFYGSGYERAEHSEDTCTLSIEIRTPRGQLAKHDAIVQAVRVALSADNSRNFLPLLNEHSPTHCVQVAGIRIDPGNPSTNAWEELRHNFLFQQAYRVRGIALTGANC